MNNCHSWKIATSMVKNVVAIALAFVFFISGEVAHAQQADCLAPGNTKLPSKVAFDDGSTIAVVDRLGDKLRTETTLPDGRKSAGSAYRGLFVLMRELPTMTAEYRWNQDLAQFFPLKVGKRIVADAGVSVTANKLTAKYATEMAVVAEETVRIGGCDYPVLKIEISSRLDDGAMSSKAVQYYHAASMLNLRSIIPTPPTATVPSRLVERRAVRID